MTRSLPDKLHKHSVLGWAPGFAIQARSGRLFAVSGNKDVDIGPQGLRALQLFATPRSLADALDHIPVHTAKEWVELCTTVLRLMAAGVLEAHDASLPRLLPSTSQFGGAAAHISMLNDTARTRGYLQAIASIVKPGQIVLDLGTGTGILAVAAAKAGARHVYAIEESRISECAARVFERNGVADRVTLLRGRSTHIELPEPADVLITETIGASPLAEEILSYTSDACRRLLKPGAMAIPGRLVVHAYGVKLETTMLEKHRFTERLTRTWSEAYGVDFSPLTQATFDAPYQLIANASMARRCQVMTETVRLSEFRFPMEHDTQVETEVESRASGSGQVDAAVVYFRAFLTGEHCLTNAPADIDDDCSWQCPMFLFEKPIPVRPGARVRWHFSHGPVGTVLRLSAGDRVPV